MEDYLSTSNKPDYELLRELNELVDRHVPAEPKPRELNEGEMPVDMITEAIAERLREAERKGLSRILDKHFFG